MIEMRALLRSAAALSLTVPWLYPCHRYHLLESQLAIEVGNFDALFVFAEFDQPFSGINRFCQSLVA